MSARRVTVCAPSRLHFGMFSFGQPGVRQFGGVGAMIEKPEVQIAISPSADFYVKGSLASRAAAAAERAWRAAGHKGKPACRVDVVRVPRQHVGLGVGTQLAMAVAAGLYAHFDEPPVPPGELARRLGRGKRSAVGLHGFAHGGLLVEAGKHDLEQDSPLVTRCDLPATWRFVLICPRSATGLSGDCENQAFMQVACVDSRVTDRLCREALLELVPSALKADFHRFSRSLFRFGSLFGECFAPFQGGVYSSAHAAETVSLLRELGVEGAGQSSWGPVVYALADCEDAGRELISRLPERITDECEISASPPCNRGARIIVESQP
jgi:beta-RFAP synthase